MPLGNYRMDKTFKQLGSELMSVAEQSSDIIHDLIGDMEKLHDLLTGEYCLHCGAMVDEGGVFCDAECAELHQQDNLLSSHLGK